jgi:crotonobetainyl-CoA:carnitine CoA-transferase CaiB-like acyl-CoA transferase
VTGFGQDGPYAQKAGHDLNYLAHAGILSLTGSKDSGPAIPGVQMADVAGGAYMTVIGCLSALWARAQTGRGQHVDVAMLDSILPLMTLQWAHFQALGEAMPRGEMLLSGGLVCYNVYECADGKFVALSALETKFWQQFCETIGVPLKFSATPAALSGSAPKLGQHTVEILREMGYGEKDIEQFVKKGIIVSW